MAREAEAMGLGEDDTIIRRRLAQKLKFLVEDTAQLAEPSEAELRQFYAANASHFETPGKLSFRQIYFNPEHRDGRGGGREAALAVLSAQGEAEPTAGDRLLFGDSFDDTDELALSGMFGEDFAREVFALEPGAWRGPVKSGYGFHLVFVTQRTPTAPKPFETVRDAVLAEWRGAKQTELSRAYLVELRKKYGVELDDGAESGAGLRARTERSRKMSRQVERPLLVRRARAAIGYLWPFVLAAAIALLLSERASAHEVRPAYLSVQEEAPNEFSVLFKTPMQGDARLALKALFSARIETVTPIVSRPTGDAMVQTWRMRTLEPLAGQNVLIDGLQNTMTDALVRVAFADGNTWTARLTPSEPSAAIPASQSAWAVFATYVRHGVEHIAFGFDHLLFVAALMLIVRDWRRLVKAITAFTVAHSITLTCATLGWLTLPSRAGGDDDRHQHRHGRGGGRAHGARAGSAWRSPARGWWPSPSACCTASALPARWSSSDCRRAISRWHCSPSTSASNSGSWPSSRCC